MKNTREIALLNDDISEFVQELDQSLHGERFNPTGFLINSDVSRVIITIWREVNQARRSFLDSLFISDL